MIDNTNPVADLVEADVPLDWITLEQFGNIIGYPPRRLYKAKEKWPVGLVWQKIDNKIYFSIEGWNQWLNEQATKSYRPASDLSGPASKLTSRSAGDGIKRRYHSRKQAPEPLPPLRLERS